ncbi:MAG: DUF6084 family protein [Candidatus Binataceae bacterium]
MSSSMQSASSPLTQPLGFAVETVRPERYAAVPTLTFVIRVEQEGGAPIHTIALRCQIRIEPNHRRYSAAEQRRLEELFGETPRWGDTLKPFLWTNVSHLSGAIEGSAAIEVPVSCTYDFEVAAAKYLHSLDGGEIPLLLLFSGTVFARDGNGFQVSQVPWRAESSYRMPVRVWREMMDLYYPDAGWLRLRRDTLDKLMRLKTSLALASWEQVFDVLLANGEGDAR